MKRLQVVSLAVALLALSACSSNSGQPQADAVASDAETDRNLTPEPEVAVPDVPVIDDVAAPDTRRIKDVPPVPEVETVQDSAPIEDAPPELPEATDTHQEVDWGAAGNGCMAIVNCAAQNDCSVFDEACWLQCALSAPQSDIDKVYAITKCFNQFCPDIPLFKEDGCIMTACGVPVIECYGDDTGTTSCADGFGCLDMVTDETGFKTVQCFAAVKSEEQQAVQKILTMDKGLEEFYWVVQCMAGQGNQDCYETQTCLTSCPQGQGCFWTCLTDSSPETKEILLKMYSCQDQPCMSAFVECVGGHGDKNCGTSLDCMGDCSYGSGMESEACMTDCLAFSSPAAVLELMEFFDCADLVCPQNSRNCPQVGQCMTLCTGINPP